VGRIVIAEDHPIIRRGLSLILSGVEAVDEAGSPDELLEQLRQQTADVLLMSASFADDGIDVLRRIKAEFPALPVLIFDKHPDDLVAMDMLRSGASGYIQTENSPEDLFSAVGRIRAGGQYLSQRTAEKLVKDVARGNPSARLHDKLSERELQVFHMLGAGKTVGEIARKLRLSVKTVSTHRTRILEKTGLKNNADIIRYVIINHVV
jgi:two-component system, NarL family, invasion response regulator UvrY